MNISKELKLTFYKKLQYKYGNISIKILLYNTYYNI